MKSLWFLYSCLLTVFCSAAVDNPQVVTQSGVVEGKFIGDARAFLGIPYAAPPVGERRWRPPEPVEAWTGVRSAKDFGPRCPQNVVWHDMVFRDAGPSEDCLNLNVWTPLQVSGANLPVLVWIHGGGLHSGGTSEATCDGARFAARGAVVVSIGYRLGIFGFMLHPDLIAESPHGAAGNYGLLDQIAALRWVRDNIHAFGGDPGRVTLFGQSAGANCIDTHMASPLARGLFHRAIGQSGSNHDVSPVPNQATLSEKAARTAAFMKEQTGAADLTALRALPPERLLAVAPKGAQAGIDFTDIVVDGYYLRDTVDAVFAAGAQNDVPLLITWTREESVIPKPAEPAEEALTKAVHQFFPATADEILAVYPGNNPEQAARSLSRLGDDFFTLGSWKWLRQQIQTGRQPAYLCRFDRTPAAAPGKKPRGAVHSSDLPYVFGTFDALDRFAWTEEDRALSALIQSYWINFAREGNPNGHGFPEWPTYSREGAKQAMYLNSHSEPGPAETEARHELLQRAVNAARAASGSAP